MTIVRKRSENAEKENEAMLLIAEQLEAMATVYGSYQIPNHAKPDPSGDYGGVCRTTAGLIRAARQAPLETKH